MCQTSRPARLLAWTLMLLPLSGCALLDRQGNSLVPTRYKTTTGPYAVYTNFPLPADSVEIRDLQSLERNLETQLGLRVDPASNPIEVYILDDKKAFTHFLTFYYPELPPRRAFFFAQGPRRVVYAYKGERLEEDLRHEATHALLHAAVADLPLWLDEGLAEYFEVPDDREGWNVEHLSRLPDDLGAGWAPDLRRLESLKDVREMTPRDYRESWAWVHYLLHGENAGKAALLSYLADLRTTAGASPLSQRLDASAEAPGQAMIAHLRHAGDRPMTTVSGPQRLSTVRLQNDAGPISASSTQGRRRGLFGRFFEALFGR